MNHKLKTILFKTLTLLPNKVDDYFYHKIQSSFDKLTLEDRLKSVEPTYLRLSKVLNNLNIDLKDKTIFEFGSGWFPGMPYFFKYKSEAKKVYTFDINKHFKKETYVIHFISPSDLRKHNDSNLSLQVFLQYSKEQWNKIHTKFDYHNRLRLPSF